MLLAAALVASTVVQLTAPAVADTGPAPLGISRVVVDEAHSRVFVSPGPGSTGLSVTDLDGQPVATWTGCRAA